MIKEDTMAELLGLGDDGAGNNDDDQDQGTGTSEGDAGTGDESGESSDGEAGDGTRDEGADGEAGDSGGGSGEGEGESGDDQSGEDKRILLGGEEDNKGAAGSVDFETALSEKSGGRFKTYADVEAAIADAGELTFANDMVAKLNEYVKQGGTATNFLKTQTVNFKEMSDLQAIKEFEALSGEGLTSEEIDLLIEDTYGVSENATDREKTLAKIKIKRAGENAKKELLQYQEKWATPEVSDDNKRVVDDASIEKWKTELSEAVDSNAEIVFTAGKEEFKYKLPEETRNTVKGQHDLRKFWDRYKTDTGYDVNKYVQDQYILNNWKDIVSSLATHFKGKGAEDIVDDIKNVDLTGNNRQNTGTGSGKSVLEQIGDELLS